MALYVKRIAELARTMPLREATNFLRGALAIGGDHPALESVRATYLHLRTSDAQLELIAGGQMRLPLDGKDGAK